LPSTKIKDKKINYSIKRSSRRTLSIIINVDKGVEVRAPLKISENRIENFIKNKSKWIFKKLEESKSIKKTPPGKEFSEGEEFLFMGKKYALKILRITNKQKINITLNKNNILLRIGEDINIKNHKERIKNKFIDWFKKKGYDYVKKMVNIYSKQLKVRPKNIKMKKQKARWGSCSSKKNLNFNWKIIMAPEHVINYLILHEVAHLKHPNHSKKFYREISKIMPDYKKQIEWLKINGNTLNI